jgi:hypothetical protein
VLRAEHTGGFATWTVIGPDGVEMSTPEKG